MNECIPLTAAVITVDHSVNNSQCDAGFSSSLMLKTDAVLTVEGHKPEALAVNDVRAGAVSCEDTKSKVILGFNG